MEAGTPTGRSGQSFKLRAFGVLCDGLLRSGSGTDGVTAARAGDEEVLLASRVVADGIRQTDLAVPAIHCGACIRTIEKALGGLTGVESARANLSANA